MEINNKIYIILPVFNEESVVCDVISGIKAEGYENIIVVDDGSTDNTHRSVMNIKGVVALRHFLNRGKGAAIKTGIEAAKFLNAEIVVTMDGDGQHNANDIKKMIEKINEGYDVVLGNRFHEGNKIPLVRVVYNKIGNVFTLLFCGLWVKDSQSGLRAYSKKAIELIDTKTDRYEYDSEVIREIKKNGLKFIEVPITVEYTMYSRNKKEKQNLKNGIKTLLKMLTF